MKIKYSLLERVARAYLKNPPTGLVFTLSIIATGIIILFSEKTYTIGDWFLITLATVLCFIPLAFLCVVLVSMLSQLKPDSRVVSFFTNLDKIPPRFRAKTKFPHELQVIIGSALCLLSTSISLGFFVFMYQKIHVVHITQGILSVIGASLLWEAYIRLNNRSDS